MLNRVASTAAAISIALAIAPSRAEGQFIIAHRGASADAPENTLAAFRLAWRQGADGVEGDFYLSADGQIVCIHDPDTKRVADANLNVAESSFAELRQLDVGRWKGPQWAGERIPTLAEVLATVPRGKFFFLEVKCGPEIVNPLRDQLQMAMQSADRIVIISFDAEVIAECERQMPQYKSYWLTKYRKNEEGQWRPTAAKVADTLRTSRADGLGSKAETMHFDENFINRLQRGGIADFHVWTVDDPRVARLYAQRGAWAITTNRPGWLRAQLSPQLSTRDPQP